MQVHRKNTPIRVFQIKVNTKLALYLEKTYNLNMRYKDRLSILEDFQLIKKIYFNKENYSKIDDNYFQVKLSKKTIKSFNCKLEETLFDCIPSISVRFVVDKVVEQEKV